jgi:hypothetical protein
VVVALAKTGAVPSDDAVSGFAVGGTGGAANAGQVASSAPDASKTAPAGSAGSTNGSASGSASGGDRPPQGDPVTTADVPDLYGVLGVAPDADGTVIHAAFRTLARKLHPDLNQDPAAPAQFAEINKAYQALKDPDTRARYDAFRSKLRPAA